MIDRIASNSRLKPLLHDRVIPAYAVMWIPRFSFTTQHFNLHRSEVGLFFCCRTDQFLLRGLTLFGFATSLARAWSLHGCTRLLAMVGRNTAQVGRLAGISVETVFR